MTMQLQPSMVSTMDLSRAGHRLAFDKTGTGKVARDVIGISLLGGIGGRAVGALSQKRRQSLSIHAYKLGIKATYYYFALSPILPAMRGDKKIGFRFGAKGVMPLGTISGPLAFYIQPSMRKLPIPFFGFGFTAVPKDEPRFLGISESRGGEHTTSSGTPITTKSIVGPSAKPETPIGGTSTITPRGPQRGYGGKTAGGSKKARGRRAPYCWVHKKRHFCKFVK